MVAPGPPDLMRLCPDVPNIGRMPLSPALKDGTEISEDTLFIIPLGPKGREHVNSLREQGRLESELHHNQDGTFCEDASQSPPDNGPRIHSTFRRRFLSIFQEDSASGANLRRKRLTAEWHLVSGNEPRGAREVAESPSAAKPLFRQPLGKNP